MSDTPLADSIPDPEQDAHDNAVPMDVPDTDPVPDDDGAAVFVAATDPVPDATPESDDSPAPESPVALSVDASPADNDAKASADEYVDVFECIKDTNTRIRNIETLVSGFIADAKPMVDKVSQGGIAGLLGALLGR